jgi:hypothetical protein
MVVLVVGSTLGFGVWLGVKMVEMTLDFSVR